MRVVFYIVGAGLALAGLFAIFLIVQMIQHPSGMGMEQLAVPIVGIIALGLLGAAAGCFFYIPSYFSQKPPKTPAGAKTP